MTFRPLLALSLIAAMALAAPQTADARWFKRNGPKLMHSEGSVRHRLGQAKHWVGQRVRAVGSFINRKLPQAKIIGQQETMQLGEEQGFQSGSATFTTKRRFGITYQVQKVEGTQLDGTSVTSRSRTFNLPFTGGRLKLGLDRNKTSAQMEGVTINNSARGWTLLGRNDNPLLGRSVARERHSQMGEMGKEMFVSKNWTTQLGSRARSLTKTNTGIKINGQAHIMQATRGVETFRFGEPTGAKSRTWYPTPAPAPAQQPMDYAEAPLPAAAPLE